MSESSRPPLSRTVRITRVLAVIAAVLGFSALIIRYARDREMDWTALSGGVLMLMIAFTAGRRR